MKKYIKYLYSVIAITLLILASFVGYQYFNPPKPKVSEKPVGQNAATSINQDCTVSDDSIVKAINDERSKINTKPLTFNSSLDRMANYRASEQNGNLDNHAGFQPYLNKNSYMNYQYIGEDQSGPWSNCFPEDMMISNFKSSEKHWKSLMNTRYDEIGVGYEKGVLNINLGDLKQAKASTSSKSSLPVSSNYNYQQYQSTPSYNNSYNAPKVELDPMPTEPPEKSRDQKIADCVANLKRLSPSSTSYMQCYSMY